MLTYQYSEEEKVIREKFDAYEAWVFEYAKSVFEKKILPYLKKYRLVFIAGNGTFFIGASDETPKRYYNDHWATGTYYGDDSKILDRDKMPKWFMRILESEIPGMNNDLGSIMPDYAGEED